MIELRPCPFCGGRSAYVKECSTYDFRFSRKNNFCVRCPDCEMLFGLDLDYGGEFETEDQAVEAWNRRADEKTGKWELSKDGGYYCPFCGTFAPESSDRGSIRWKERRFCYFCGAKLN